MQNKLNTKWRWLRLIFLLLSILFPLRIALAAGGIATDGTVGPAQRLSGPEVDIDQRLGTTVGKNLFHSFSEFNVNNGQTVTFRENTPNALDNVISRVTGGSRSEINGTLSSTPDGHANLYLVNPSGVMFGKDARIDVPGAFHASTADEVRFQDGARFSASQSAGSTLTAAAPASFGFLSTSSATNGLLKIDGAQLAVGSGKKLDIVGRNISVENGAKLSAPEGEVRLEAVGTSSMNIPIDQPSKVAHGSLALTKSTIDTSGEGGGKIIIRGSDLNMDQNAKILAKTNGKENGAGIDVRLTGDMTIKSGSLVQAGTTGNGASGKILVIAENLQIDGQNTVTGINTETGDHTAKEKHSTGRAGDIELRIGNKLSLARSGQINASSFGTGDAGNVTVKAGQLLIDGQEAQNLFQTGIFSIASKSWSGQGGDIAVDVQGDLNMKGGGSLIQAGTSGSGASGNILVTAKNLSIDGLDTITGIGTEAGSSTAKEEHSTGRAGDIELRIGNKLSLARSGQINSSSYSTGAAGNITVRAGQLLIDGQEAQNLFQTGIFSIASKSWSGQGGDIAVDVQGDLNMIGGGSLIQAGTISERGASGNIWVTAKNLRIDGQNTITGIGTEAGDSEAKEQHSTGRAGDIELRIGNKLSLARGGQINSSSYSMGNAGNVTVKAGQLLIDTKGVLTDILENSLETGIFTAALRTWSGRGGNIDVHLTDDMDIKGGGLISAITYGNRTAGSIVVNAQSDINLKGGSIIEASTRGRGYAGNISVTAKNLLIDGQAIFNDQPLYFGTGIASETGDSTATVKHLSGRAGDITLHISDQLSLVRGGQISSRTFGTGAAGKISVTAGQLSIEPQGILASLDNLGNSLETGIFTSALRTWSGKGGNIDVHLTYDMDIKGGGLISAISHGANDAGNVTVSANRLTLEQDSFISTAAESSNGGNITINGGQLVQLIKSKLITNVQGLQGNSGNITINAENLVMETGLIQANTKAFGATAGNIKLNIKGLIPSGQSLFKGLIQETPWTSDVFGLNVIEAVAPNGISGLIQSTAPQLDLSGVLSNLGIPQFDVYAISQDYCSLGTGSTLIRQGKGGLPLRSRDSVLY